MDDVRAVMDAVGSERAGLLGVSEGGAMGILFAATHPDRTSALVLLNTFARTFRADDYYVNMTSSIHEQSAVTFYPSIYHKLIIIREYLYPQNRHIAGGHSFNIKNAALSQI